jgi:phytoene dehydrogenase-like protein
MIGGWPVGLNQDNTGRGGFPSRSPGRPNIPKGGAGMTSIAIGRCIEAHGGVILTNKNAVQLIIEGGRCVGVECADGSTYRAAKAVLSTVHIKRLVDMAPKALWGEEFLDGVSTFQTGTTGLNTLYATREPILFPVKGGTLPAENSHTLWGTARCLRADLDWILGDVDLNEPEPILHIRQPSVVDPTRAPAGFHTVRLLGRQPYNLRNGGPQRWDEIKEQVSLSHLRALQRLAPNFTDDKILAKFIESPLDIERMNPGMYHGSCHGGTDGPAQAAELRPVPGWAQHRMPIPGLYQTGGTTHPGGGVGGWPGRNAAMVMLKDFGTSLEEVVKRKTE